MIVGVATAESAVCFVEAAIVAAVLLSAVSIVIEATANFVVVSATIAAVVSFLPFLSTAAAIFFFYFFGSELRALVLKLLFSVVDATLQTNRFLYMLFRLF